MTIHEFNNIEVPYSKIRLKDQYSCSWLRHLAGKKYRHASVHRSSFLVGVIRCRRSSGRALGIYKYSDVPVGVMRVLKFWLNNSIFISTDSSVLVLLFCVNRLYSPLGAAVWEKSALKMCRAARNFLSIQLRWME